MLYSLDTILVRKIWNLTSFFVKTVRAISRTAAPILGLFVLISMHFSCWIQIWQWKFEFWNFLKNMLENFHLPSAHDTRVERFKHISVICNKITHFHICISMYPHIYFVDESIHVWKIPSPIHILWGPSCFIWIYTCDWLMERNCR